jgi:hypothetical protein
MLVKLEINKIIEGKKRNTSSFALIELNEYKRKKKFSSLTIRTQ